MKKRILCFLFITFGISVMGQHSLNFKISDGTNRIYNLENTRLLFSDFENIFLFENQKLVTKINIDSVQNLTFGKSANNIVSVKDSKINLYCIDNKIFVRSLLNTEQIKICILDISGKIQYLKNLTDEPYIDIAFLKPGVYLISINNNQFKFVKQ